MAKPLIVSIPHKLGQEEATRRLKAGLGGVRSQYAQVLQVNEEIWSGNRLAFRVTALKQQASGTVDVAEDHVKIEVLLPSAARRHRPRRASHDRGACHPDA